jgi:hypothetical protein
VSPAVKPHIPPGHASMTSPAGAGHYPEALFAPFALVCRLAAQNRRPSPSLNFQNDASKFLPSAHMSRNGLNAAEPNHRRCFVAAVGSRTEGLCPKTQPWTPQHRTHRVNRTIRFRNLERRSENSINPRLFVMSKPQKSVRSKTTKKPVTSKVQLDTFSVLTESTTHATQNGPTPCLHRRPRRHSPDLDGGPVMH